MKKYLSIELIVILLLLIGCTTPSAEVVQLDEKPVSDAISMAEIDSEGQLLITLADGQVINVGFVQGEKGEKGNKGDKGDTGASGQDGVDGKDGKNGIDGKDGQDGKDGINGHDGLDGASGSGSDGGTISLADCATGTSFPCNPNPPFDIIAVDRAFAAGSLVQIESVSIVLTKKSDTKEDFNLYSLNPNRSKYSSFHPYIITVSTSGKTDPSLADYYVNIGFNVGEALWWNGKIRADGTFGGLTECPYNAAFPREIWVSGMFIAENPGGG